MIRVFLVKICTSVFIFLVASVNAQAQCLSSPVPNIFVRPSSEAVIVDNKLSYKELEDFKISSLSPYQHNETQVHGLMQGPINIKSSITVAWEVNERTKQGCFWYDTVDITIELAPVIFIAKSVKPGTCRYKEIYGHEMKHVNQDRALANEYVAIFKQAAYDHIKAQGSIGPYHESMAENIKENLSRQLRQSLAGVQAELEADRMTKQLAIDSLEEYDRVARSCSHEKKRVRGYY